VCGIAGLYRTEQAADARLHSLKGMLAHLRHRGPDEMGYYCDDAIAMGTARLSIVDLETGQQPITDASGRFWIVFNGEIYNHTELRGKLVDLGFRFTSRSDTEVLLAAWIGWGPDSLLRLNGAFAFAIFDKQERSLVIARDRFGKRPLYYIRHAEGLVFGSEMKSFLAYEQFRFEFDGQQLSSIFQTWTPLEHQSGYRSVHQVPAGAYLVAAGNSTQIIRYATLGFASSARSITEGQAVELVRETLSSSVRLRLRADVEAGAYLSGGIDSAIVAHLIAENRPGAVKTFSISFEDAEFDERSDQQLISSFLGSDHAQLNISATDIVESFPQALWHAEVPVFRTAFVPMFLLSKFVRAHGLKIVLTGEGADEAFLGYDIFKETLLREQWASLELAEKQRRVARLYPYLRRFGEYDQVALVALFNQFSQDAAAPFFSHELRFHNSKLSGRLLQGASDALHNLRSHVEDIGRFESLTPVQRAQWLEYKTLLGGYLLSTQGDRMSLAHSVENRCPFLDPNVVELASASNLKFNDGFDEKYLLKKAFAGNLPERILTKPKQPYRAPDASAFLKCRPDYLEYLRSEHELKKLDVVDTRFSLAFVNRMLAKSPEQVSQAENQAFLFLLSVALLHRRFIERPTAAPDSIDSLLVRRIDGRVRA
jgi:asparagine synthase (glutamine-hydrolysing)